MRLTTIAIALLLAASPALASPLTGDKTMLDWYKASEQERGVWALFGAKLAKRQNPRWLQECLWEAVTPEGDAPVISDAAMAGLQLGPVTAACVSMIDAGEFDKGEAEFDGLNSGRP